MRHGTARGVAPSSPVTVLFVLAALGVVLAIGLLAVVLLGELPPWPPDRTPDRLPEGSAVSDALDGYVGI